MAAWVQIELRIARVVLRRQVDTCGYLLQSSYLDLVGGEMSDRLGIVRYFWGERTAIMNGVATIRNGLALGGSNRIAGGT